MSNEATGGWDTFKSVVGQWPHMEEVRVRSDGKPAAESRGKAVTALLSQSSFISFTIPT